MKWMAAWRERYAREAMICSALVAGGCSGSSNAVDLPAGWESANVVQSFSQAACGGSADDPAAPPESIEVTAATRSIHVTYHHAHFRCEQALKGFVRIGANTIDFLVQPTDMNPSVVAACDCLYEVELGESVPSGATTVTVYRRLDHHGGNPVDPETVGMGSVTVP